MHHRWLIPLVLLLVRFAPAAAQVAETPPSPWRLIRDAAGPPITFGLTRLPLVVPLDFRLRPADDALFQRVPFGDWVRDWAAASARSLERDRLSVYRTDQLARAAALARADSTSALPRDSLFFLPPVIQRDTARAGSDLLGGMVGEYADLGMRVTGTSELGGSWTRYQPCDPSLFLNCNPSLFPRLKPDVEFGVTVAGTVSDRIHVNVDYDQRREDFSASNNISLFYQGLPDEILQRVEVGDVALSLPRSTYLTRGVPSGNFGLMASGQLGPLDFQAVWAQQRGDLSTREFRLAGGGTQGLVQDDRIVLDDADYVKGQFFFLLDPARLAGAPHVDILALQALDAPATHRPEAGGAIELYRDERINASNPQQQAQLGIFLAEARSEDGSLRHTGQFRRLTPDLDYTVHNSGLWIVLRSPLRSDEALAVSFITESGDTVGTVNAERAPPGTTPPLRLLRSPVASHQPGRPTWAYEMHQVYRVNSSSTVELSSVDLRISLGDIAGGRTFREVNGRQVPFLKLFGLDEDAPADVVDVAQIYQPGRDDFDAQSSQPSRITGTFVVFPTLEPFLQPAPVPSANLSAAEARAALGGDANDVIYNNADPVLREGGARFRLTFSYRVRVDGLVSSFSLGQFGIREGSDRLQIGERVLQRDVDYTIDYEIGTVTLNDAQALFGANPGAEIRATWEQKALFDIAPTSVFGASATYRMGARGELNFMGLFQSEKTLYSRPQLGVEPGAIFLGGTSARLDLGGPWLDRALQRMPGFRAGGLTSLHLDAEMAFSLPDPNRNGAAYLDDFEASNETPIDVRRQQWRLGSAPQSTEGDADIFPSAFDLSSVTRFVWQHDISTDGAITGNRHPRDIDRQINIAGNAVTEPVMWLTFGAGEPAGERRWRSITTVLSTTGIDLTRTEYLEFYSDARGDEPLSLVFDIGTVSEDAFYVDSLGNTTGTYPDGRPWGLGLLDEEARVAEREIWGPDKDARGLWDQNCQGEPLTAYPWGDARSNCTRGNGVLDTEDLDGNGIPDLNDGAYFRYIVQLTRPSEYLVRDTAATGTTYRLYRIPLRAGRVTAVNGASDGTWRFIKHLRMTVVGEPSGTRRQFSLARIRMVGSRWAKRDVHGIQRGLLSDEEGAGAAGARLEVGPVGRITHGASYTPPPGVRDQLQDPSAQFGGGGIEFNERSMRVRYQDLSPDDRAEVYLRYPQAPQNFLRYRQMRLWAVAREGDWGAGGTQRLTVRIGTDARNYYLFQTRLKPATGDRPLTAGDWLPEIVIDFEPWFQLKAIAEQRLIEGGAAFRQDTVWSADSTYAIVLEDRARAPNLAAVRELAFAVYNGGASTATGEVWLDDLRLEAAQRDPGMAGTVNLTLSNEAMSITASYANRGSVFHQLGEEPTYLASGDLRLNARTQLDAFLPETWGIDMPFYLEHTSSAQDPRFLERSDVRADRLGSLRETGGGLTRMGVQLRKRSPTPNPWLGLVLDGATLRLGYNSGGTNTITSRAEARGFEGALDYRHEPVRRDVAAVPGFLESALRFLAPAPLEQSEAFERLVGARLRWSPRAIGFNTSYYDQASRSFRFDRILAVPEDSLVRAIESPRQGMENGIELGLSPFEPLLATVSLRSSRDLLPPERASTRDEEREALDRARSSVAGTDIGWETRRSVNTALSFRPSVSSWLRPSYTFTNRYSTDRNPSYLELLEDSSAVLQRRFGSDRQITRRLDFQPSRLLESALGPAADSAGGAGGLLYDVAHAFQSLNFVWNSGRNSQFERERGLPGTGYQLGLGDFSSFRFIGEDTSATAIDRDDFRTSSAFDLPVGGLLTLAYQRTRLDGFDQRGGRRAERQTMWPSARITWRSIPVPGFASRVLLAASAGAGYEHAERSALLGGRGATTRGSTEERFPLELSLTFAGGVSGTYTGTVLEGSSTDPTGDAEHSGLNHSLQVSGVFQPPSFLKPKVPNPLQARLIFTQDDQRRCRFRPQSLEAETCVRFVDTSTRALNFTLDTRMSDLNLGVRLAYTARQNHVGTRTGSNQFQFGIFGEFNFTAGQMPAPGGVR